GLALEAEATDRFPGLDEHVLGQVLGVARMAGFVIDVVVDAVDVDRVQLAEGVAIALRRAGHEVADTVARFVRRRREFGALQGHDVEHDAPTNGRYWALLRATR